MTNETETTIEMETRVGAGLLDKRENGEGPEVSLSGPPTTNLWRGALQGEPEPGSKSEGLELISGSETVRDLLTMTEER